jgi:acrylyl-CoA reductase (NADPH)
LTQSFRAMLLEKTDDKQSLKATSLTEDDLMPGDVTIAVDYSTLNFKDGLAMTGASPVVRSFPMIPGIDLVGTVTQSDNPKFSVGDKVLQNGYGLSEVHYGGYAQKARVNGDWVVKLPSGISPLQAMAIGTAGYTAMLCVMAVEEGVAPDQGEILVTGAAGGVGSVAIALLSKLGYSVVASTGRAQESDYLKELGASRIIDRATLSEKGRPLDKELWAGVVDSVGSHTLANAISQTKYGGVVAACGLAQGVDLPATVMPFILRGVTLRGIDSVQAPMALRERAWARLEQDLDLALLDKMTVVKKFDDLPQLATDILAGQVRGRVVIDVNA